MFEECLYFNTNALARTVTRIWTDKYRQFDLSPPHAFLLRTVLSNPGMFPRELANELNLTRSTITRFLDSLENNGFLIRKATETDGREVKIYPTPKAKKIHTQLNNTGKELTQLMGQILGEDELSEIVSNIREVKKTIEEK
ncbi:MAG: MarR family transcriptional regulator [Gammaproteobacteria bacterium]|nr:MarR family transcriptional regulator [Gammaproteobacteria bacterium]